MITEMANRTELIGRLALAEMKLIIARIVWNFDLGLAEDCRTWGEDLKIFHLWVITPLYVKFTPVERG